MKKSLIVIICFLLFNHSYAQQKRKTVRFSANDGVKITADLYMTSVKNAPFILLYHQAGYSRGEYREIAPKLNELGFNCMAIDQRSGKEVNGVINQTNLEAKKLNKPTQYVDAIPDLEAAYLYVKYKLKPSKVIIWGSSYSAAITFFLGSAHYNGIDGILAFSPGEYFKIDGKEIKFYSSKVKCPVFITSAKDECDQWRGIYNPIKTNKSYFLPENEGKHGSKALWNDNIGHEEYWNAVTSFLMKFKE